MNIKLVTDKVFKKYGRILNVETPDLLQRLKEISITDEIVYEASVQMLEECKEFEEIKDSVFGGMPIQIGYCNGKNNILNAVEYHRNSEVNILATDAIFIVGLQQDITDEFTYDTSLMEVFAAPKGAVIEFYATTLHYAPCNQEDKGFAVAVILPKGTNTESPQVNGNYVEDKLLQNKNKWLIAHKESGLDKVGAFVGLVGDNIKIEGRGIKS